MYGIQQIMPYDMESTVVLGSTASCTRALWECTHLQEAITQNGWCSGIELQRSVNSWLVNVSINNCHSVGRAKSGSARRNPHQTLSATCATLLGDMMAIAPVYKSVQKQYLAQISGLVL